MVAERAYLTGGVHALKEQATLDLVPVEVERDPR
jgi:hypothetical protein